VVVIPITDEQNEYAHRVAARLRSENVRVVVDAESERMQKKVREAKKMKVPYLAIVGAREAESGQVNIRNRADEETPEALEAFVARITAEIAEKRRPDR
jgi:threonyl-tRNA synthetase